MTTVNDVRSFKPLLLDNGNEKIRKFHFRRNNMNEKTAAKDILLCLDGAGLLLKSACPIT